jgi:hypothetical protein
MTNEQLSGLIRALGAVLAGYALKLGIDDATWLAIVGGISGIAVGLWSWYSNTLKKQIDNVANSKEVTAVVTDTQKFADSIPNEKVISANDAIASIGTRN